MRHAVRILVRGHKIALAILVTVFTLPLRASGSEVVEHIERCDVDVALEAGASGRVLFLNSTHLLVLSMYELGCSPLTLIPQSAGDATCRNRSRG